VRVALVAHRFPERSEPFLVDHALGLLASGVDVHVVADEVDPEAVRRAAPALIDRVHAAPSGAGARVAVATASARAAARRPGAALAHLWRSANPSGRAAALARDLPLLALRPDVVHTEFLTLARHRTHLPTALGCALTSSIRGYEVAYAGLDDPEHYADVWPALTAVHVLGEDLWARAVERGCPPDLPHHRIPPAVDAEAVPRARPAALGPLRLVSIGRLHWKKGHHHTLQAVAAVRSAGIDASVRIVGDGPHLEELAFARHQLGLDDHVTFVRGLGRPEAWAELAEAQVFVHAAVTEGFGNAVLEAQAAGLPVVCTDAEGLAENVAPGVTGIVVPRRDPAALADALLTLARDPERRVAMGEAGHRRARTEFRPDDQRAAFLAFFRAAVS